MKTYIKIFSLSILLGVTIAGSAAADLAKRIDAIVGQVSRSKVRFSIHIVKADSGQTVYSLNSNTALMPASNMKIIVTAAAMKYLGADYEYKTKVGLCGDNLVIIGSGDPLLGDKDTDDKYNRQVGWIFENIAAALKQNNRTIVNDIIIDGSVFDSQRTHPNWRKEELNRWYACEVSGLNFNDNCIEITAKIIGGKATISIEPATNYVEITNKVVPVSKGRSAVGSYRQPEPNKIVVFGKCKNTEGPFDVAIEKPAEFFALLLKENLTRAGIKVNGQVIEKTQGENCNLKILAEFKTPIADCLARANKNSLGLAAEALLKTMAADASPDNKNGGWVKGREMISQYLLGLGIDKSEFYIDDGSGLSRENRLTANTITKVLLDLYKSKNWQFYKDSLAVGGMDGTIGKYFEEGKYKGRIFGKTGYISNVKSFSGLCSTNSGDYIFSILANGADGQTRDVLNDIAKAIIDESDTANPPAVNKSKG